MPDSRAYTATFTAKAHVYKPSDEEQQEAFAGLSQLKSLLPPDIVPEDDLDLLYIVGDLAVAGYMNLNADGVTIDDALSIYRRFERRQCNIEHNRKQIVGFILKAGLSELGTNRLITEDEARAANVPFNIVTVAALWKVANRELCQYIMENSVVDGNDCAALSLSFEVGFDDYSIALLPRDVVDLSKATKVIPSDSPDFERYDKLLRINKGSGNVAKTGESVGRILKGTLVPLGQGVVTIPAAAVKGIAPVLTNPNTGNGHSFSSTQLTLDAEAAQHFMVFGASIPDEDLYVPEDDQDGYGREDCPHITAFYGIKDCDTTPVEAAAASFDPIKVKLGKMSAFEHDDKPYDVLKVDVESDQLHELHHVIKGSTDNETTWPDYHPHLTIGYLLKGKAAKYVGDARFEGQELTFVHLTWSPHTGPKAQIPFKQTSVSVYIPDTMTIKANRVKLPAGIAAKAKELNYPKADVTLSDGRVLKGVTVFNGDELELDKDLAATMDGVVIMSMTPQQPPGIDDSPVVHPRIDTVFPTVTPEKQADNAAREAAKKVAQNAPYTDAILRHLEAAAKILHIIQDQISVSSITTPNSSSPMKLDDLKQIEAKLKTATKPEEISEAIASISLFAEEIAKASEKHVQAAKDAEKAKDDAEKMSAAFKIELAEAKKTLQELRDAQASNVAEAKFNERMTAVAEHFDLDDEVRAFVVDEVRACADDASFDKAFAKMKKTMKGFIKKVTKANTDGVQSKDGTDTVNSQDKTPDPGCGTQGVQSKDGSETPISTEAAKQDKKSAKDLDKETEDAKAAALAIASAQANPVDTGLDGIGDIAKSGTITEQMMHAFAKNTSVGGRNVAEIIESTKKKK